MRKTIACVLAALMVLCLTGCGSYAPSVFPRGTAGQDEETRIPQSTQSTQYTVNTIDTDAASELRDQAYTNVPGAPTQKAVLDYTVSYYAKTEKEKRYNVSVLEPDELIVNTLTDIYDFVQETKKMPVRYFSEEVQRQVQEILGGTTIDVVDILHVSEFFGIRPEFERENDETGYAIVQLDEEYLTGQLVVVMFGDTTGINSENLNEEEIAKIQWTPLRAKVEKRGEISFEIPSELLKETEKEETLFLVLTIRRGGNGTGTGDDTGDTEKTFIPSKDAGDLISEYEKITSADGTVLPDNFRIFICAHNDQTYGEIARLQQFMEQEKQPIAAYFDAALQAQMALLTEDTQPDQLICYNANFLGAEEYVDTYGDVVAGFRFATAYQDHTQVVCVLGTLKDPLPEEQNTEKIVPEESLFEWMVLRGEVREGYVFITFPQQQIPVMEQAGALALILSQPIMGEENQKE